MRMVAGLVLIVLASAGLIGIALEAKADAGHDTYTTHTQAGVGSVQTQTWTIAYPGERPEGHVAHVAVSLDNTQAGGWTIGVELAQLVGCTVSNFATATTPFGATARVDLNVTGTDCHGAIRFSGTSGTMTARINARVSILAPNVEADNGWADNAALFAFLLLALFVVLTRLIRKTPLRVAVDLAGFGILALPVGVLAAGGVAAGLLAMFIFDTIELAHAKPA